MKIFNPQDPLRLRYEVNGQEIPSRFFLAPINTGFFSRDQCEEGLFRFHNERSGNGIGISYVGNVAIGKRYLNAPQTPYFNASATENWKQLSARIQSNGSIPGIQLACEVSKKKPLSKWTNRHVLDYLKFETNAFSAIPTAEISRIQDKYFEAARFAWECGFKVIQIHAAHGYFLSRLLSNELNRREDEFGDGTAALIEVVKRIQTIDKQLVCDVRLSLQQGLGDLQEEFSRTKMIARSLANEAAILSFSNGMYNVNRYDIYPKKSQGQAVYANMASEIATELPDTLVNVAGNIWDIESVQALPLNVSLGVGRQLIADPKFVTKCLTGNHKQIANCKRCHACHYFSRGKSHITCGVNPSVG